MTFATLRARCSAFLLMGCGLLPTVATASEPGWRTYTVPASAATSEPITVALSYPTRAPARSIAMGPFTVRAAIDAPPEARVKGLIILSHGTGGSELAHSSLAEALARHGYLVAALRHPGDNWQDRSLFEKSPGAFFRERPRQVSRVIDALLADPDWKDRIATDARGPRIGVLGHSAGGYTAVALAGGQVDLSRMADHCRANRADDPILCAMARTDQAPSGELLLPPATDARVRAVVAMAPLGVMFTAASLAGIKAPVAVYAAALDRWLVPRFHAEWIARTVPGAAFHPIANAWHFAFMVRPATPIQTADGDAAADPPGFDRAALLAQLAVELPTFFDQALTQ
ncbi:MAG: dienelactone hydrolase [Alphaproteobacteria bacterium]|nr:dienelactone hydrolase [Alphaproteobacteria bacterium]